MYFDINASCPLTNNSIVFTNSYSKMCSQKNPQLLALGQRVKTSPIHLLASFSKWQVDMLTAPSETGNHLTGTWITQLTGENIGWLLIWLSLFILAGWLYSFCLTSTNIYQISTLCPISQWSPGQNTTAKTQNVPSDELIFVHVPGIQWMPNESMLNALKQKTTLDNGIRKIYNIPWGLRHGGREGTWGLDSWSMWESQLWDLLAVASPANFITHQVQFDPM